MKNPDWLEERVPSGGWGELVTDGSLKPDTLEPMVSRSVRMSVDLYEWLRTESKVRGLDSWSELVRVLIEDARRPQTDPVIPVSELQALIAAHAPAA